MPVAVATLLVVLLYSMQKYGALRLCSIRPELMAEGRTVSLSNGRSTTSGQMVVKLKRDPHAPHVSWNREASLSQNGQIAEESDRNQAYHL